ncbi:MAG: hypothetical protein J6Z12_01120 [Paludibacteraceae bacterium]|nr:hypothetical protein [Paludibacteraceae bacterium]
MGFFPKTEIRQFNLKPRYYDEHKERIAQSRERVRRQLGLEEREQTSTTVRPTDLHGAFRDSLDRTRSEKRQKMVLGLSVGFLLLLFVVFMHYVR